jgi:hypothetical protein
MDIEKFNLIKQKYGHVASWAIWKEQGNHPPMFNIGDLSVLDPQQNPNLLSQLKPDVVFVGLNTSRDINDLGPFSNFHSSSTYGKDYKIRYATMDTKLWGGYMTDIIKDHVELQGQTVRRYLNENPDVEDKNIEIFRNELKDLGTETPTIIAFGGEVYRILTRNLNNEFNIFQVTHYAHFINQQNYRDEIKSLIERIQINSEIRKDKSEVLKSYKEKNVISEEKTLDNFTNKTEQILTELKRIRLLLFVIVFVLIVGFII